MNEKAFHKAVSQLQEYETQFRVTKNPKIAMLICPDGTMYTGTDGYGNRVVDHRQILEPYMTHSGRERVDRYSGDLWIETIRYGLMVVMPETPALILPFQPTDEQISIAKYLHNDCDYYLEDVNGQIDEEANAYVR